MFELMYEDESNLVLLSLVNNLTPLGLRQLKTGLPEGRMNFKIACLKSIFFLNYENCSSRLPQKAKRNFERSYVLL